MKIKKARKFNFYTTCENGHKYHISWPFCPHCKGEWIDYHRASIGQLRKEIVRHEEAIKELEAVTE